MSIKRLMSTEVSLRRSPSTLTSSVTTLRIRTTSSSERSFTRVSGRTSAFSRIVLALERPIPKMYVRPISTLFWSGRSTPAIRAICYPCLCLCFGIEQMTRTTPFLRTTLHFTQILLTDALTFTTSSSVLRPFRWWGQTPSGSDPTTLFVPINDPPARQVVGRELHEDLVARKDPDEVLPHLSRYVREHLMFVLQLHFEHRVRQRFDDRRHDLDRVFLRHAGTAAGSRDPAVAPIRPVPRTIAPAVPIATVYSKCADALRSRIRTVHPSRSTVTSPPPRLNIGSIARTIPGCRV